jgi:hypothetical protein
VDEILSCSGLGEYKNNHKTRQNIIDDDKQARLGYSEPLATCAQQKCTQLVIKTNLYGLWSRQNNKVTFNSAAKYI